MINIQNKKITVIGARRSGQALARLVSRLNGVVKISEAGPEDKLTAQEREWLAVHKIPVEFQGHTRAFIEDSDFVVLSPGVRFDALPVQWARAKRIPVLGEIEFAFQFCRVPVIAVTGSNGKTTVVTLIYEILKAAGYKACLCGNVGYPFSDFVLASERLDFIVLEVSSFQMESIHGSDKPTGLSDYDLLERVQGFRPHIAVILNFSQNHLDRHKDLEEYFQAKTRILMNQAPGDFAVLNHQDARLRELSSRVRSGVVYFGQENPRTQGRGRRAGGASTSTTTAALNPNHLAVLEVARIIGIEEDLCLQVFQGFKGVEHRCEKVRNVKGVEFINDSKSTTTEATRWALKNVEQPVILICGGRDKNVDFSVLSGLVGQKVKKMIVIGEARAKLRKTFAGIVDLEECEGLEQAVGRAQESAVGGDCVLLSPMCASFDMFANFEDRGKRFKDIVAHLS
ncbi:MAG TPA: UDP-N-acetylmuramoyl-L-alanine--D-glutamate ligase [Candidatus Omnitrophica bacterium]|nr:MAG: UDP-N-acetylmuramoylalanine--D-glutamate ligase [Omnitrophica WOR_2 bacterium GWA2_45_18]HBR15354.1 UDP-N-acetylmuramoyl-L-alanine--D-glutamate ligase [Candidatus Omnitrophota bacterium]